MDTKTVHIESNVRPFPNQIKGNYHNSDLKVIQKNIYTMVI